MPDAILLNKSQNFVDYQYMEFKEISILGYSIYTYAPSNYSISGFVVLTAAAEIQNGINVQFAWCPLINYNTAGTWFNSIMTQWFGANNVNNTLNSASISLDENTISIRSTRGGNTYFKLLILGN